MPPAAFCTNSIEEAYDGVEEVGGIEVEAVPMGSSYIGATRIRVLPRDYLSEEENNLRQRYRHDTQYPPLCSSRSSRDDWLSICSTDKSLADSFDSQDEIDENSNEAKLLKRLVEKEKILPYSLDSGLGDPMNSQDPWYLDETEAKYLDVLDRHLEETDPAAMSFQDLEDSGPDDPHPKKSRANVEDIIEHFLDAPCCECAHTPLKSALKPSKWTFRGSTYRYGGSADYRKHSVKFKEVDIREFQMTLGNHPSATSGPPVMIDWNTIPRLKKLDIETYEQVRQPRRNRRQLKLSLQQRHNILVKERGFTFEEVKSAWQEALEIRKQRKETLERGLALMKWDEVWESTCRKFNRLVDGTV